jgi:hypothetical protein
VCPQQLDKLCFAVKRERRGARAGFEVVVEGSYNENINMSMGNQISLLLTRSRTRICSANGARGDHHNARLGGYQLVLKQMSKVVLGLKTEGPN